jgi:hypothetical protein
MTTKAVRDFLAQAGSKGGKAGVGASKRRDQDDPDYYKRISAKAAAARKAKRKQLEEIAQKYKPALDGLAKRKGK